MTRAVVTSPRPGVKRTDGSARSIMFVLTFLLANVTLGTPLVLGLSLGTRYASIISVILVVLISAVLVLYDGRVFILYWIQLVLLQNAVSGLWFSVHLEEVPLTVSEAKTMALAIATVLLIPKIWALVRTHRLLVLGLGLYAAGLGANITTLDGSALANLRNFVLPIMILIVSTAIGSKYSLGTRIYFLRGILGLTTFWLVLGAAGELILGTPRWRTIFHADAMAGLNSLSEETSFFGIELSRVGGLLIEPVNAGYVAASVVVVLITLKLLVPGSKFGFNSWVVLIGALVALGAAATKNGLMMFFIAFIVSFLLLKTNLKNPIILSIAWGSAFASSLLYASSIKGTGYLSGVWTNPIGLSGGESTSIHLAGLISGFRSLLTDPLGNGIGSGGNFYKLYNPGIDRTLWLSTGSESAWGTLIYQGGILCLMGLVIALAALCARMGKPSTLLIAVWSAAALFAESFFGPIAASILLISAGFLAMNYRRGKKVPSIKLEMSGK